MPGFSSVRAILIGLLAAPLAAAVAGARTPRIANGLATAAWPEVAALLTTTSSCSATFAGCSTVITAAHCVCGPSGTGDSCGGGEFVLAPESLVVFVPQAGFFGVNEVRVHPNYSFGIASDLAVLELDFPIRSVRPRRINTLAPPPFGTKSTIVGFGRANQNILNTGIKRVGAVTTANCSAAGVPNSTHVCWEFDFAIGPPGTDSNICPGDSGGPLLADLGEGTALVGVHSGMVGDPCEQGGVDAFDSDIFADRSWIRDQAGVDLDAASCGDGAQVGDPTVSTLALDGVLSSQSFRSFFVPADTKLLRVGLSGERGVVPNDIDLYLKFGSPPGVSDADCASAFAGSFEYCEIPDPMPGTWHALVNLVQGVAHEYQLTATLLPENPPPPPLSVDQIVVSNFSGFELTQVDPANGDRVIHSSSLRGIGPDLAGPEGIALDRSGGILVANPFERNLLHVDAVTGDRAVVSGCVDGPCLSTVGAGPAFLAPRFVALEGGRQLLVADRSVPGVYAVVRVDALSGDRTILSGCTDADCSQVVGGGPPIARLFGIAREPGGGIVVADGQAVLRINPTNGDREILSGCIDASCSDVVGSGPDFGQPVDLVIDEHGALFVTYRIEGASFGAVRRVDPATGARTLVSGCEDEACNTVLGSGPDVIEFFGIAFDSDGELLVADLELDAILHVDKQSGARQVVSGCADAACSNATGAGAHFSQPADIVVVPEPGAHLSRLVAIAVLAAHARRRRGSVFPV